MMSDDVVILGITYSYFTLRTAKPQKASSISTSPPARQTDIV